VGESATLQSATLLFIDDDAARGELLANLLEKAGHKVERATSAEEGLARLGHAPFPDAALVDLNMPLLDGSAFLERAKNLPREVPVVVMTAEASIETAVAAMRHGAFDFLVEPFESPDVVLAACARAVAHARHQHRNRRLEEQVHAPRTAGLVGIAPAMDRLRRLIEAVAPTEATVLIVGETGTGKELVARAVHDESGRRAHGFVPVNCGALSETLLESELFGHVRGAFTGATNSRRGLIEAASGGTLFLDEVGELSLAMQTRLLRVLQEGEIRPVGADAPRLVDVRVVAATHRDLREAVNKGLFREDLYYRLNVFRIEVLPLRDRREDIPVLAAHFVERLCARLGRPRGELDAEALAWLCERPWPGNLRQLENTLERAIILAQGTIGLDLIEAVSDFEESSRGGPDSTFRMPFNQARLTFERRYLRALLDGTQGSRAEAARRAGLDPSNFRRLLKRHGLE
jgi:two-component system response regulator HydG